MSAGLALVLATISWFALAVLGLGMLSAFAGTDIIATPGLGQLPGVIGMIAALAAFAALAAPALRRARPTFVAAATIAPATALAHLFGVWAAVLAQKGDVVLATSVAGELVRGGASLVLMLTAAMAAWGGVALRRTRSTQPRWPWEREDPEEQ